MSFRLLMAALVVLSAPLAGGCSMTPSQGPLAHEISNPTRSAHASDLDYIVIDIDNNVVGRLAIQNPYGLGHRFSTSKVKQPLAKIGPGDQLAVTIWEAGEGGLFSNAASKQANFPQIVVDKDGRISLPYAGIINVTGRTPLQVQEMIVKGLAGRAIQPQALVTIVKNENHTVVLSGDITTPGRHQLTVGGDRLLDVIASAGGSKFPARETYVTFMRGSDRATQLLETIIQNTAENVFVYAGDRIYLNHDPKRFSMFGAIAKPGVYVFPTPQVNLLEAIAGAGGLLDERSDSTGLFLFRYEQRSLVEAIAPKDAKIPPGPIVPVVYRVSLRDPGSYFYAKGVMLKDKDVLYVANAKSVEISKVLTLLGLATRAVGNVTSTGRLID